MLLDLGNEETHTVASTAITEPLKAVPFAGLLIATSIPQTDQHAHTCSLPSVQATRAAGASDYTQRPTCPCSPRGCPTADSRTARLSPETTLSLSGAGAKALLSSTSWASDFPRGMPAHCPLCAQGLILMPLDLREGSLGRADHSFLKNYLLWTS